MQSTSIPSAIGRFRTQLLFLILLLVLPVFALVIYSSFEQQRIEKLRVREAAMALSQLAAANEENFVKNTRQLLATLSQIPFLVRATDRVPTAIHLTNLLTLCPDYINFGLIEADGQVFCSAKGSGDNTNLGDRSYFQRVLVSKTFSAGNFQIGRLTREPSFDFGYPIMDEEGKVTRVLFASLRLSRLTEAMANIRLPSESVITVLDKEGTVLAHYPSPDEWVGKNVAETQVAKQMLDQNTTVFEMPGLDHVARLHAVAVVRDDQSPRMYVLIGLPVDASYAQANTALIRNLISLSVITCAVLVAAWLYAQHCFVRPIESLVVAANSIATGDLHARVPGMRGNAELAQLEKAFNGMAGRLQTRQREVDQAHQQIQALNRELEQRVEERTVQLTHANYELEAFSYSVSHDLRAPLRHVSGFVDLLKRHLADRADDITYRYIDTIADSAKHMGQLVDDLLSFSRMGRAEIKLSSVNLLHLIENLRSEKNNGLNSDGVEWEIGNLPEVKADPPMMQVVMTNLLSNAIKYSRKRKPPRIKIMAESTPTEHIIVINDNGAGFDMEYVSKLFGVFQRLHHSNEFEGTGIGLAIVQRVILRHGGRIWATGEVDAGATFYFSLPRDEAT